MRIAVFDHVATARNPAGGCVLRVVEGLAGEHEFTVFAAAFDDRGHPGTHFVRVPAIRRPQVLLYLTYLVTAPLTCRWHRRRRRLAPFDLVEAVEPHVLGASLVYAHFCHTAYLRSHWRAARPDGVRRLARYLDHRARALLEGVMFGQAEMVVATSRGLADELVAAFPRLRDRVIVVPNAVDLEHLAPPADADAAEARRSLGVPPGSIALSFAALGHFERKGLPALIEALATHPPGRFHLMVAGGTPAAIKPASALAERLGVADQIDFVGTVDDLRPILWASDAFVLPTRYETFSLVTYEAAAAGVPVVATPVHGVADLVVDGVNGLVIEPTASSVAAALERLHELGEEGRRALGAQARTDVQGYGEDAFVQRWRDVYARVAEGSPAP